MNQDIINEIKDQDYDAITRAIENFLLEQLEQSHAKGIILGLSGGIDSAVLAHICKRKLGDKTLALIMPDTEITPESETKDALKMIVHTQIKHKLIDIRPIINEYQTHLEPDKKSNGNLRARVRTNILYYYANARNYLVLGSSDKSEFNIGYFTKFGDGASDVTPIISLYKLQVRELAKQLGVPDNVIAKKSSPHLWEDHQAETELGASYEEIDSILYCMIEKKLSVDQIREITQIDAKTIKKIHQLHVNSEHKRLSPVKPKSLT